MYPYIANIVCHLGFSKFQRFFKDLEQKRSFQPFYFFALQKIILNLILLFALFYRSNKAKISLFCVTKKCKSGEPCTNKLKGLPLKFVGKLNNRKEKSFI